MWELVPDHLVLAGLAHMVAHISDVLRRADVYPMTDDVFSECHSVARIKRFQTSELTAGDEFSRVRKFS